MSADSRPGTPGELGRVRIPVADDAMTRQWLTQRHRQTRPARPASAVVLVRDGDDGVEVLLRHRSAASPLGRVGFPGGSLLESDADMCPWHGPDPASWSRALGLVDRRRTRQHLVAAVRELFEEAGVLLAGGSDTDLVRDARGETWGGQRSSLEHGDTSLPRLLADRGLGLRTDLLRPVGRWQSAPDSPRRFDTIVFAAVMPPLQEAAPRPVALTHQAWLPVADLLAGPVVLPGPEGWLGGDGAARLDDVAAPMTTFVLDQVARHRSAAGFMLSLGAGRRALPVHRLRTEAEGDDLDTGVLWAVAERVPED